ncbi:fimbrial biogenesis chaperone [Enterobacter asburiae]|uniref:fimbrial biogenesis chaperone n=1 Tax=Enterobacter asburiae TaxID=61645 RepID=UPI00163D1193|nr:molecular chaperone [Enterobacter asburiae]
MRSFGETVAMALLAGLILVATVSPAQAFMLGKTRVVLPEGVAVTVPVISGKADDVLLIRSRVAATRQGKVPVSGLILSPPLFRLEKGTTGTIRLQAPALPGLPVDRESVMYLSVSGLPSTQRMSPGVGVITGGIVAAMGLEVKVFYRPKSMSGIPAEPWKYLTVSRVPGGIKVNNPSPFHITFQQLSVDGHAVRFEEKVPMMLPPFGSQIYVNSSVAKKTLSWTAINDLGGKENGTTAVQ